MVPIPLQKRPNDLFVSYGHVDRAHVDPIVNWLRHSVGLKVWYDAISGNAAERTSTLLANAIQSARGALFFLSPNWAASTWCEDEHEFALTERRSNAAYSVVAVQIDDLELPRWFKIANVLDFRQLDARSAAALLRSMVPNPPARLDNDQDVYFAGPWSRPSRGAERAVKLLHEVGWRLVGDSPDRPHFPDARQRIASIIDTSRALVAVLPFDGSKQPDCTSPWIMDEVQIASDRGRPYLLLAEGGVQIPAKLANGAFRGGPIPLSDSGPDSSFPQTLTDFDAELAQHSHSDAGAYSFLATSLLGDQQEMDDLISVIERASSMVCVLGQGLTGQHAQQAIVERIRNAAFVIADVTDDNRNSLVGAGIARGAGTPLHLLCRLAPGARRETRFMFRDMEVNWYENSVERLGAVYRIASKYRRRVLTPV
jgi:hypothetical protein